MTEHAKVRADATTYARVVKAFLSAKNRIEELENQIFAAKKSQIEQIRDACANVSAVDEKEFEDHWRKPIEAELLPHYKSDAVMKVQCSYIKTAVIAFTNGYQIDKENDTNLQAFVSRVRPDLKANGLLKGNNRSSENGQTTKKPKPTPREESLKLLAVDKKDLDAEDVRARMAALDYILKHHGWQPIIELARELQESDAANEPAPQLIAA